MRNRHVLSGILATAVTASGVAQAGEHPIGDAVTRHHMEIAAVYLQPVKMAPELPRDGQQADIHLEADIHATEGNPNGFAAGAWVPYLGITYTIEKQDSDWSASGQFMPMVAADGPHYADNITLDGPGKYHLTYRIAPPPYNGFYRHTDKETGVGRWWAPFELEWDFAFTGAGKKGGY